MGLPYMPHSGLVWGVNVGIYIPVPWSVWEMESSRVVNPPLRKRLPLRVQPTDVWT